MQKSILRLFGGVQVERMHEKALSEKVQVKAIRQGYVLDQRLNPSRKLLDQIESVVGLSGEKANQTFHKSWQVVKKASLSTLVAQQVMHYMTTYGFAHMGIYDDATIYIPAEKLDVPEMQDGLTLTVVKALSKSDVRDAIIKLGSSGMALAEETLQDVMTIVEANRFDVAFVEKIQNRELLARLYDFYGIVPQEPVAFLRHLISKLTDESLLIKNDALIEKIKGANGKFLDELLKEAPDDLASIFLRYKPLFLAMKSISKNKTFFNRLRKDAVHQHKPLQEDYLNSVTAQIKRGALDLSVLSQRLAKANIFRKIRLAYALKHRLHAGDSIVYPVRTGKGWADKFTWPGGLKEQTRAALDMVVGSIVESMAQQVKGKVIHIPAYMHYAIPATEKQFTGHFPTGTSVDVADDLIVGVHWMNTGKAVDLDLSVISQSGKYGWDADYRSKERDVLFSGDMTSAPAPHGATELFYIKSMQWEAKILMLNYYNHCAGDEAPAKLLVASERADRFGQNYMVDPNHILASANLNITRKQNILGLVVSDGERNRAYFAHMSLGASISASRTAQTDQARKYLVHSLVESLDLADYLEAAGATVVRVMSEDVDIDLSPQRLDKNTILSLLM